MPYTPGLSGDVKSVEELLTYVQKEFDAISREQTETTALDLRPVFVEPKRPREGMIIFADGTEWDPGDGKGAYVYKDGDWQLLGGTSIDFNTLFDARFATAFPPEFASQFDTGTWTPSLTCVTPGNLAVTYAAREGHYIRVESICAISMFLQTATFTHTTASGRIQLSGIPFPAATGGAWGNGLMQWDTWNLPVGYTDVSSLILSGSSVVDFTMMGDNIITSNPDITALATGVTHEVRLSVMYEVTPP